MYAVTKTFRSLLAICAVVALAGCGGAAPATQVPSAPSIPPASVAAVPSPGLATPAGTSGLVPDIYAFVDQVTNGPHDTVTAADGSAELLIPAGALPAGKAVTDITISPVDAGQAPITLDGKPPIAAWDLQPDGLQFTAPALFRVTRDSAPATVSPALVSVSSDGATVEALTPSAAAAGTSGVTISAPILHFTNVDEMGLLVGVRMPNPGDQVVRNPFTLTATASIDVIDQPDLRSVDVEGSWHSDGPLDPPSVQNAPEREPAAATVEESQQFTCTGIGSALIRWGADFTYEMVTRIVQKSGGIIIAELHGSVGKDDSAQFNCLGPTAEPVVTPEPSFTPQPTSLVPTMDIGLNLGPGRDGQVQFGVADLIPQDAGTQVVVNVKGASPTMPATINEGTCSKVGAVKFPLSDAVNGTSSTVLGASLADLFIGQYSINVAASPDQANTYVACGDLPKGVLVDLGPGRDGDQTPATAVLLSFADQTQVFLDMNRGEEPVQQPASIDMGSCSEAGVVKLPLRDVYAGTSQTYVRATLADLLSGGYSIRVQRSTSEPGVNVVCGDLK